MSTETPALELRAELSSQDIDLQEQLTWGADLTHGATSIFLGVVRNHDPQAGQRRVVAIDYSAHPHAVDTMRQEVQQVCQEVLSADTSGVSARVTVIHRIGKVHVGEPALLVIVATAHRHPGIDLVPLVVERIKQTTPIWKEQIFEDGSSQWSNLP